MAAPSSGSSSSSRFMSDRHIWHHRQIPAGTPAPGSDRSSTLIRLPGRAIEQQLVPQQWHLSLLQHQPPAPSSEAWALVCRVMKHLKGLLPGTSARASGLMSCRPSMLHSRWGFSSCDSSSASSSAQLRPCMFETALVQDSS